jgi:prepilin-type N-terminal cleavage/methylation domain-containing protein
MQTHVTERCSACRRKAFTLVEVVLALAAIGIMVIALYGGISYSYTSVRLSRENERATQILTEHMEVVRLLNWDQVANLPGYVPTNFTAPFFASGNATNPTGGGFLFTGVVTVATAPISESYSNDLRMITIQLSWLSGSATHQRQVTTFVSQYGMQNYIY